MRNHTEFRTEDISYGKHLSVIGAMNLFSIQLDNILIYHLLGPTSLALFSFATMIPERIRTFFGFISSLALPKIAERDQSNTQINLKQKIVQLIIVGLSISLVYIIFVPPLFHWLFPQYNDAILYSQIFSLSLIAIALNISNTALIAQRKQTELYYINTITPIGKIILTILGVWYLGILGAVISRIVGYVMSLLFTSYFLKNENQA